MSEQPASDLDTVTWWEIPVADLERSQRFYGDVFGWTFAPFGEGFAAAFAGGRMIGGLFQSSGPAAEGIRIYVNVADLESVLGRVPDAGGSVRTERTFIGEDMGWWADFADPDGRVIGVCTSQPA